MNEKQIELSIIIVNWNVKDYLKHCLVSVFEQVLNPSYEVIVIDNDSSDGSKQMIREHFPQVKLIENETNNGFGRANNQGAKIASGEWLLLLNPDTLLEDNLPSTMIDFARSSGSDIVGPRIVQKDRAFHRAAAGYLINFRTVINQSFLLYRLFPKSAFFSGFYLSKDHETERKVDWVSGACMLIKKDVFSSLKGFNPKYFLLSEDREICFRAKQRGNSIMYFPKTSVIHFEGRSISKQDNEILKENAVSFKQMIGEQNGTILTFLLNSILWLGYLFRIMIFGIRYKIKKDDISKHKFEVIRKYGLLFFGDKN